MASASPDGGFTSIQGHPVLNPLTPMAYLPPDVARETTVASHIIVGTLAILIWDVLNNLSADWRLLTQYRIRLPTLTYFASRFCSLVYVLWSAIYYTGPVGHCFQNEKGLGAFYPASVSLSALLFFFRVRIVYQSHPWVVALFFLLWLSVVAGTLTVAFGVLGVHIGPTDYCLNGRVEDYVSAAAVIPLVNDTLVFLAITWKLATDSHILAASAKAATGRSGKRGWWEIMKGDYLPGVSKALLKDGQTYYMVTVFSNLLTVVMIYMSSLPATYRTIFSAPNIMLINVMACRVYRHTKFGVFNQATFANSTILATNIKNAAHLPVAFRHTTTTMGLGIDEEMLTQHSNLDTTTVTLTRGGSNSGSYNTYNYKAPTTPNSDMDAYAGSESFDVKRPPLVVDPSEPPLVFTRDVNPQDDHDYRPPHYPPSRKYSSSDSRF